LLKDAAEERMKKIIIIVGGVLLILGSSGAGVYFLRPDLLPESIRPVDAEHAGEPAGNEEKKAHEPEVGADLDVFVVNLAGAGPARYLRTTLSLGVKDEHEKEKIKEFSGPIRHAVIMYLTERRVDELLDPAGKNHVREELHKQINHAIGDKLVTNVYFKEFLIQ
jgi:flagellar FliL protein